ncbi:MAG TPA: acyl-CoA dehydrogenase family protein [Vicinamibacterales bacterium]|nr:acyl-CoA dehydrogenase family protein [Vicinamibacterales bacterium]
MTTSTQLRKGGSWLLEEAAPGEVFTPEKLTDEHQMMAQTAQEFVDNELLPAVDRLEAKDWDLARSLMRRAADLGLFGIAVPEEYGGLDLDKASSLVVVERLARAASFATTFGGQANLCILPLVMFGTDDQKARYLPKLVAGEIIGAYALSESGSGSDALAARTRATRQPDGSWRLNGEKMWITNGGFADLIVVFAKVDGEQFTAFLVERGFPGVSSGNEEHKMGLHGSSTTPIILQDAQVPAGNVLGEVGKGHKVALNTLNYGRFSLGAMCGGGCRGLITDAVKYANTRRQFGQPIATFGAIKHKLGEMIARTYAVESLSYRTAGLIDEALAGSHRGTDLARVFEEYAIEASIAKVIGTEVLDYVLDENVQIHGGNGFVKDYTAERYYRDARVNRIFEGTNEINRLLIPGMLVRRALKGELALIPAAKQLQDELLTPSLPSASLGDGLPLADEARTIAAFKKVVLMVLGTAMQTYGEKLTDEQEVLSYIADIVSETFAAESAVLRAQQAATNSDRSVRLPPSPKASADHRSLGGGGQADPDQAALHEKAARVFVNDAAQRLEASARSALAGMSEGDTLRTLLAALRRVLKVAPINTIALRRDLADAAIRKGGYIL